MREVERGWWPEFKPGDPRGDVELECKWRGIKPVPGGL